MELLILLSYLLKAPATFAPHATKTQLPASFSKELQLKGPARAHGVLKKIVAQVCMLLTGSMLVKRCRASTVFLKLPPLSNLIWLSKPALTKPYTALLGHEFKKDHGSNQGRSTCCPQILSAARPVFVLSSEENHRQPLPR